MNKQQTLKDPQSCLNKAEPDEPLFVIRAKDPLAPATVRHWCTMAIGSHESSKVAEARSLANEMEDWRKRNVPEKG